MEVYHVDYGGIMSIPVSRRKRLIERKSDRLRKENEESRRQSTNSAARSRRRR